MFAGRFFGSENTGAFQHHVDLQIAPGQVGGIALGENFDAFADFRFGAQIDPILTAAHGAGKMSVVRIVAQQMRVGFDRSQIVDGDEGNVAPSLFVGGAQHQTANAAKSVDRNTYCHVYSP